MTAFILLCVSVVTLVGWWVYQRFGYWKRRDIPHDKPCIPSGNMFKWKRTKHVSEIFQDTYNKYKGQGPFAGFYFFFSKAVIALELDFVKSVLIKDFDKFHNRGLFHNERDDPLTANLVAIEGQKWRNLRQKLTPTFTSGKMKVMFPTVIKVGDELVRVFNDKTNYTPQCLEVVDLVSRYTADVIGSCAFGLDCNSLHNPKAEFVNIGRMAIKKRRHSKVLDFLIFGFPKLAAKLRLKDTLQVVEDFYMGIITETINYRIANNVKRNDFMDMLIDLKRKHDEGNISEGLTLNEIAAQAFIFFLAGFETSSTTMSFALYELALNQNIQDKLRDEIKTVLAKHKGELSYECLKEMVYLEQVVDETLRKRPVVGQLLRLANQRFEHSNPKYSIEPGTVVFIPVLALHFDPEYYPEPEKFIPERFSEENIRERPSCTYLPFGEGPRNCIGLRFGKMQALIGLAKLIQHFKFEVSPTKTQIPLKLDISDFLRNAVDGVYLNVTKL